MSIYLGKKLITPGELLWADDFKGELSERWEISRGEWCAKDGVCRGAFRQSGGGLIFTKEQMPEGDIMLDFYGKLIPPCENDLNFTFRTRGWNYERNGADVGYIGGLNGWWTEKAGLEKCPDCKLYALTEAFKAESGREYHIQTGIVGNICFLAVDGVLLVCLADPDPITLPDCNRVGLGTYCSQIEVRDFKVYRPCITPVDIKYVANF